MRQCLGCSGLVPEGSEQCPNCEVSALSRGLRTLVAAGTIAVTSLSACAAQPLYGAPCVSKQVDGGNNGCIGACDTLLSDGGDPRHDVNSGCFTDGGTP